MGSQAQQARCKILLQLLPRDLGPEGQPAEPGCAPQGGGQGRGAWGRGEGWLSSGTSRRQSSCDLALCCPGSALAELSPTQLLLGLPPSGCKGAGGGLCPLRACRAPEGDPSLTAGRAPEAGGLVGGVGTARVAATQHKPVCHSERFLRRPDLRDSERASRVSTPCARNRGGCLSGPCVGAANQRRRVGGPPACSSARPPSTHTYSLSSPHLHCEGLLHLLPHRPH